MTEFLNRVYETIDEEHADKSALTRRRLVAGAATTLGSMGLLGLAQDAYAQGGGLPQSSRNDAPNTPENIVNIAATAEVLATIVTTVGPEKVKLDDTVKANIQAAAREELIHYQALTSSAVGAKPVTKMIWVPDEVFANQTNFLETIVVGDQIFINAYLLGGTVFARSGGLAGSRFARYAAEFMGAEAVHRAIALVGLGRIGTDRAFMRFAEREQAPGLPTTGTPGFYKITDAVSQLEAAGFGFGKQGSKAGQFYDFDSVSARTPDPSVVNTRSLS